MVIQTAGRKQAKSADSDKGPAQGFEMTRGLVLATILIVLGICSASYMAWRGGADKRECFENLQRMETAFNGAAQDLPDTDDEEQIQAYLCNSIKDRYLPKCPSEGIYDLGGGTDRPSCSVHGYAPPLSGK